MPRSESSSTLKVSRISVTSCDLGRQTSTQIEAAYQCPLPQESRETRAPQHSLFPNPGQTRVPRAASLPLAAPPTGLSRTGPAGNQGPISSPPSIPSSFPLERRDFPGPFKWHLSRSKNFAMTKGRDTYGSFEKRRGTVAERREVMVGGGGRWISCRCKQLTF